MDRFLASLEGILLVADPRERLQTIAKLPRQVCGTDLSTVERESVFQI